ncbi:MAG: superfamily II DNA or RNA helicase, partial [Flammeovirgaceae bacterium]
MEDKATTVSVIEKELYPYQAEAIEKIFTVFEKVKGKVDVLFQLPTGGGKTIIFSEIAKKFIGDTGKNVLILTHRVELCAQTSKALSEIDVKNKIIDRDVKELHDREEYNCYVAMVETLNNRLTEDDQYLRNVGLV